VNSAQVDVTNGLGTRLIGPHGAGNVQQQDGDHHPTRQQKKSPVRAGPLS
jgi:hypothetical protein